MQKFINVDPMDPAMIEKFNDDDDNSGLALATAHESSTKLVTDANTSRLVHKSPITTPAAGGAINLQDTNQAEFDSFDADDSIVGNPIIRNSLGGSATKARKEPKSISK